MKFILAKKTQIFNTAQISFLLNYNIFSQRLLWFHMLYYKSYLPNFYKSYLHSFSSFLFTWAGNHLDWVLRLNTLKFLYKSYSTNLWNSKYKKFCSSKNWKIGLRVKENKLFSAYNNIKENF